MPPKPITENTLFYGDNLPILREYVPTESVDLVQTSTAVLGSVVNSKQILELPLNGRNFAQLGLLQPGVAPLTAGLATHGGPRRSGQGYTVNGQRPESKD